MSAEQRNEQIAALLADRPRSVIDPDQSLPEGFQPEPGQCTLNASDLDGWRGASYTEGWALDDGWWTAHAWLEGKGGVIDPTWAPQLAAEYVAAPGLDPFERSR
jgi:hypothetical protein